MEKKVSDLIADFLAEREIKVAFGIIGSGCAHIYDSVTAKGYTQIISVHHEQAAVMAMAAYFRVTGKMSAALVTTGAGAANTSTGVLSAWMDSLPGIIISGNENSKFTTSDNPRRIWGVQGFDCLHMVGKMTKYAARVMDPKDICKELNKAYEISLSGRFGPVWIDVPMNVQAAHVPVDKIELLKPNEVEREETPSHHINSSMQELVEGLKKAERPVIWLGHGIRLAGATGIIEPLLKQLDSPALVTWQGIDMIDSDHPQIYGRAGVYGQRYSNFVLQNSDFVLAIGTRLALPQIGYDITELARGATVAVVDIDHSELTKYPERFDMTFCMDAKDFMSSLLEKSKGAQWPDRKPWFKKCDSYKELFPIVGPEHKDVDGYINSYSFMEKLNALFKPDTIAVTDMGTALLSGHQIIKTKLGQRLITSTGLGEMGYGLPGAIGASFGKQKGEVLCLNCDGGMMMNLQELQTIAHHKLPIKILIFNNDGYLMIKNTQKALFDGRFSTVDVETGVSCPDFSKLANAFGFASFQIKTWDEVDSQLPQFMNYPGTAICEVFTHPEQKMYPKLGLAPQKDGSIVSPPLEDLSPFICRETLRECMVVGIHPKSEKIEETKL